MLLDDPQQKVEAVLSLQAGWLAGKLDLNPLSDVMPLPIPGRPEKPELVDARDVPRRNFASLKGRLTLVHAIAHIEFNAINLALDAVYRFQDMPKQYYTDWLKVAAEEAKHFTMLSDYLESHAMSYGDLAAHNGLWEMAVKTDFDVLVRMALVPRVLEARGLDVTPGMIKKLQSTGDERLIGILQVIFDEEIGHVKIGTHWYKTLCSQRNLAPEKTFLRLIEKYMQGAKFGPFETEARIEAGFSQQEMDSLLKHF
ncbi:MAG: ferritin-like domain-containing protein [Gammaproteobacteria bacterium]|nr:ferritin-like domain-containing protein [Gammaproteobacteria bacterium]MBT8134910.1 ferritin-like domain-containing protein [Gammaproteobacteria bacterium]NNJ50862.1 ferritin-like domain-containing protein [Gammaproteobacteria bacterium]